MTVSPGGVTKAITAQNDFTDWMKLRNTGPHYFTMMIWGTFTANVTVQLRHADDSATIVDIGTYTAAIGKEGRVAGGVDIRIGVKTGDYSSGTVNVSLSPMNAIPAP